MAAGNEWLALLQYAVVAVQGSAVAQANLAWLLERSSRYDMQHKTQVCLRLLTQAGKGGFADAWVDAGNLEYRGCHLGEPHSPPPQQTGLCCVPPQLQGRIALAVCAAAEATVHRASALPAALKPWHARDCCWGSC